MFFYVTVEIGQCSLLSTLNLQHNELKALPENIGQLRQLQILGLRYNHLSVLPKALANCQGLQELNIENNNISVLPVSLFRELIRAANLADHGAFEFERVDILENAKTFDLPLLVPVLMTPAGSIHCYLN